MMLFIVLKSFSTILKKNSIITGKANMAKTAKGKKVIPENLGKTRQSVHR